MNKQFPKGIQTFADIRNGNYYYVDKTPYIIELVKEKFVFLSRPRRFGKSLTLDTIAELFMGRKALFEGLYAESQWDWEIQYPVIRLGFAGGIMDSEERFLENVKSQFRYQARQLNIELESSRSLSVMFRDLIENTVMAYKQPVVILVDEYDKPILDNLANPSQAIVMRDKLRDLYSIIKEQDKNIRFAMLTGVSKFSKVNLFSGLNNLTDITLLKQYSAICGYTQAELETVFAHELMANNVNLVEMQRWYNGYNWTGESVYNPYDVMLYLADSEKLFKSYWFETGSPAFLMDMLFEKRVDITTLQGTTGSEQVLSQFDVGDISPIALMFQTGYLTVDEVQSLPFGVRYTLKFPNIEVQQSFNQAVIHRFIPDSDLKFMTIQSDLYQSLLENDLALMFATIEAFFAGIPYNWHINNDIAHFEGYWASVFYGYFSSIGVSVHVEESSRNGRMDMAVLFDNRVYIFEFKVVKQGDTTENTLQQALAQISEKGYTDKYNAKNRQVYQIGVAFDEVNREVSFVSQ